MRRSSATAFLGVLLTVILNCNDHHDRESDGLALARALIVNLGFATGTDPGSFRLFLSTDTGIPRPACEVDQFLGGSVSLEGVFWVFRSGDPAQAKKACTDQLRRRGFRVVSAEKLKPELTEPISTVFRGPDKWPVYNLYAVQHNDEAYVFLSKITAGPESPRSR